MVFKTTDFFLQFLLEPCDSFAFQFDSMKSDTVDMRFLSFFSVVLMLVSCLAPSPSGAASVPDEAEEPELPSQPVSRLNQDSEKPRVRTFMVAGTKQGIRKIYDDGAVEALWSEGGVSKIIRVQDGEETRWYFLTTAGILTSGDLKKFEFRNEGLPFLTIKLYDGKNTTFTKQSAQLKDLAVHPENPKILVTSTKECVYLTRDGGVTWKSIGSMSDSTSGIKAVAVANMNRPKTGKAAVKSADGTILQAAEPPKSELVVFMAHSIFGFSYCYADDKKLVWHDVSAGFDNMKTQTYPDEISDILPVVFKNADGYPVTEVFVSQTFMPNIYRFDWNDKRARKLYSGTEPLDTVDSLFWNGTQVLYTRPGEIAAYNPVSKKQEASPAEFNSWRKLFSKIDDEDTLYSAWLPNDSGGIGLGELWLLYPETNNDKYIEKANNRKAIYVQAHKLMTKKGIDEYRSIIRKNKLDAMVIDMKDDYGGIRFEPNDPLIKQKGYVSRYKIDIDTFVPQMKADGVYLIARIVTFKDRNLAQYDKQQYAVWDKTTNRPWKGISAYTENGAKYYDEDWVDPYSPEVWEYFVHIAQELVARGFDEIQFDYIRFPTDGKNMKNATFRWKSPGMDKESALLSFLSFARKNIDAPIGIDIYGANGWYRSGTRTGQDVEQLAEYVDVVCPMFYPSHFEQSFLNYAPASERPYRVYYYGTYRNTVIGRNKLIIRPWIQAFYLNVSYDRAWYNENYVIQQIYGVRDSVGRGYMYWNGMCRYDDISPDVGEKPYPGPSFEAGAKYRKPALSGGRREYNGTKNSVPREPTAEEIEKTKAEGIERWNAVRSALEDANEDSLPSLGDLSRLVSTSKN